MKARRKAQTPVFLPASKSLLQERHDHDQVHRDENESVDVDLNTGLGNTTSDAEKFWFRNLGRCSAFVKLGDENSELFLGHTTWDDYSKMTRLFKYYDFDLPGA